MSSPVRPQYARRFDWDAAVAMYDDGMSVTRIAAELGVSYSAVNRIVMKTPEQRRAADLVRNAMQKDACPFCENKKLRSAARCWRCDRIAHGTTIRIVQDAWGLWWPELFCASCKEWKSWWDFPRDRNRLARACRSRGCRTCQTVMRRESRHKRFVPCEICGTLTTSVEDRVKDSVRRGRSKQAWPYCKECLNHSPDPRAVAARKTIALAAAATVRAA